MSNTRFALVALVVGAVLIGAAQFVQNDYFFNAAYTVLLYAILSTAWNILGGYTGYVNFGTAAFFAIGVYSSIVFNKAFHPPLGVLIVLGTAVAALAGLGLGYLTMRLRGHFFAIATLALAVMLFTFVTNWDYAGGARGAYVIVSRDVPFGFPRYIRYLFAVMVLLTVISVIVARCIEHSRFGQGLAAIRDDELAAECNGVPTLRLKLIATTISGGMMGLAGTTFPFFISFVEPVGAFDLRYAVNAIAMPVIGGMTSWIGPLIGAGLLGTVQQLVQVTISSAWNLLIVGVLLVGFVSLAPEGIMGWVDAWRRRKGGRA
jgi:branched-chain amino acid transport system permease protein